MSVITLLETNYAISRLLTLQDPPPRFSFHHFVFSMCNFPSSCSFKTAPLIAVRYGESTKQSEYLIQSWGTFPYVCRGTIFHMIKNGLYLFFLNLLMRKFSHYFANDYSLLWSSFTYENNAHNCFSV